ncbi:hypothetical protein ACO0QE_000138 [Hanseniaspora vineae]
MQDAAFTQNAFKEVTLVDEKQYDTNESTHSVYTPNNSRTDAKPRTFWQKVKIGMRPNTLDDVHARSKTLTEEEHLNLENENPLEYGQHFLQHKPSMFGRFFDRLTNFAGDTVVFLITCAILVMWMILGIVYRAPDNWQIAMQDGSSIQAYFSDSFLMRQQQNEYMDLLQFLSEFKKNAVNYLKIFEHYNATTEESRRTTFKPLEQDEIDTIEEELTAVLGDAQKMQTYNWFDRLTDFASKIMGSFYTSVLYWIGIFVWIGLGALPYLHFADEWQLYINTATAVVITFASMFTQNIRKRHNKYLQRSLSVILHTDADIDYKLRNYVGFYESDDESVAGCSGSGSGSDSGMIMLPLNKRVRAIEYYAHFVGGGVGAAISSCVFIAWICIGKTMKFSDNWWLIIGTYTGLVGFVDGFTLRSSYYRYLRYCMKQIYELESLEENLLTYLHLPVTKTRILTNKERSFNYRASAWLGKWISYSWGVVASIVVVIGLIILASGMRWSTTAQLICNTPTMIVEGFCLLALLEGHNQNNEKLRILAHDSLVRKLYLKTYVEHFVQNHGEQDSDEKKMQVEITTDTRDNSYDSEL